jgi:hypothetical protein
MAFEIPTLSMAEKAAIERICHAGLENASTGTGFDLDESVHRHADSAP